MSQVVHYTMIQYATYLVNLQLDHKIYHGLLEIKVQEFQDSSFGQEQWREQKP